MGLNPSLVKVLEQIWSIFSNLLHYFLYICTKKNEEHESEVFYKAEHKEDKASRSADLCQVKGRCNRSLAEDWNYGRT